MAAITSLFSLIEPDVLEICKPLLTYTLVDYFDYHRFCFDGRHVHLSTHAAYANDYITEQCDPSLQEFQHNLHRYAFMSTDMPLPALAVNKKQFQTNIQLASDFGHPHRLYILAPFDTHYEVCGFGTQKITSGVAEYLINHIDIFEKHIVYFRSKAKKLIEQSSRIPYFFDLKTTSHNDKKERALYSDRKGFNQAIENLNLSIGDITFSPRQSLCYKYFATGRTMKEIAKILNISHRTVEGYIEEIKNKLNCRYKSELIDIYRKILSDPP